MRVAPDGTSTSEVYGRRVESVLDGQLLELRLLGERRKEFEGLRLCRSEVADAVQRVVVGGAERDELEARLQRFGVGVGLPLHDEGVECAGVVLDRVAHLQRRQGHERNLALELLEHAGHVGRREARCVALGDRVEHGEEEVEPGARCERVGVSHHEVAGDDRVDEVCGREIAVGGAELIGRLVLHDDAGNVRHRLRADLGHRLELARHFDPQLARRREGVGEIVAAGDELEPGARRDAAKVDTHRRAVGERDAGVVECLGDLGHPGVGGAEFARLLRRRPHLDGLGSRRRLDADRVLVDGWQGVGEVRSRGWRDRRTPGHRVVDPPDLVGEFVELFGGCGLVERLAGLVDAARCSDNGHRHNGNSDGDSSAATSWCPRHSLSFAVISPTSMVSPPSSIRVVAVRPRSMFSIATSLSAVSWSSSRIVLAIVGSASRR